MARNNVLKFDKMKKIVLVFVASVITSVFFAQQLKESDVPVVVKNAMKESFPKVKDVKWNRENVSYGAVFMEDKVYKAVLFDSKGVIKETEIQITQSQLPKGILAFMKKNYLNEKILKTEKIINSKGLVTYEVEIKGKDLYFDGAGNFIR